MKVSKLKEKFEAKEGIPTLEQKLIFEGKELTDGTVYFLLLPFLRISGRVRRHHSRVLIWGTKLRIGCGVGRS